MADQLFMYGRSMADAAKSEDFAQAAALRDQKAALLASLSPQEQSVQKALLRLREAPSPEDRADAATVLSLLADPATVPWLAAALHDPSEAVHAACEAALWALWAKSGDAVVDAQLQAGIALLASAGSVVASSVAGAERGRSGSETARTLLLQPACAAFAAIASAHPDFAEAHNKHATVLFLQKRYAESLAVCRVVVALQPAHFGALFGGGVCALADGDAPEALRWFRRALAVNPRLDGAQSYLKRLEGSSEN